MDNEEVKALLKDVISNFIKDEPDAARENFHAALSAKMRERVNPTVPETAEEAAAESDESDHSEIDLSVDEA